MVQALEPCVDLDFALVHYAQWARCSSTRCGRDVDAMFVDDEVAAKVLMPCQVPCLGLGCFYFQMLTGLVLNACTKGRSSLIYIIVGP